MVSLASLFTLGLSLSAAVLAATIPPAYAPTGAVGPARNMTAFNNSSNNSSNHENKTAPAPWNGTPSASSLPLLPPPGASMARRSAPPPADGTTTIVSVTSTVTATVTAHGPSPPAMHRRGPYGPAFNGTEPWAGTSGFGRGGTTARLPKGTAAA